MSDSTRRRFLATAAGAAGGVAAMVAVPGAAAAAPSPDLSVPDDAPTTMAAYIHDVRSGEVTLMIQGHEVIVADRPLAAQLARAFARARRS